MNNSKLKISKGNKKQLSKSRNNSTSKLQNDRRVDLINIKVNDNLLDSNINYCKGDVISQAQNRQSSFENIHTVKLANPNLLNINKSIKRSQYSKGHKYL